jgi:aspartate/methionine/tyrosine aminotransferase
VHTPAAITEVANWCEEHGIRWVSDEIYEDFVYGQTPHLSPASVNPDGGLRLGGLSKNHAMMGWRLGWMTGPVAMIDGLKGLHQHLVTSAVVMPQRVISVALDVHDAYMVEMRETFKRRRDVLFDGLKSVWPQLPRLISDGAFYALLDVRTQAQIVGGTEVLALRILDEVDVVTIPGNGFGTGADGYLRLAYTVDEVVLQEAALRLGSLLAGL